jgi:hypothetical protein
MMAVAGAAMLCSTLLAESAERSFSLAAGERTKTTRSGWQLALVGPNLARS